MIEQIKQRIAELEKSLQQVVANHSMLVGHLNEAKHLLEMAEKGVDMAQEVVEQFVEHPVDGSAE